MGRQAVQDRAHAVLAHPEFQVPASVTPSAAGGTLQVAHRPVRALEITRIFQFGVRGGVQVQRNHRSGLAVAH